VGLLEVHKRKRKFFFFGPYALKTPVYTGVERRQYNIIDFYPTLSNSQFYCEFRQGWVEIYYIILSFVLSTKPQSVSSLMTRNVSVI